MIITLCSNIYKPFSHGYPKLYKTEGYMTNNKRVVLYMPFSEFNQKCTKRVLIVWATSTSIIPSPIADEPKSIKQRFKERSKHLMLRKF